MSAPDEIEMQLLGLLIRQPQRLSQSRLSDSLFSKDGSAIFLEAKNLWAAGKSVSGALLAASDALDESAKRLTVAITSRDAPEISFDDAVSILEKRRSRRQLAKICRQAHDDINNPKIEPSSVINDLHCKVTDLVISGTSGTRKSGADFRNLNAKIEWQGKNPGKIFGIETGFPRLDRATNGLQNKKFYIIGARPSVGKTSFSGCVAHSTFKTSPDATVIDYTIEMDADEIRENMASRVSGVTIGTYRGSQYSESEIAQISRAQRQIKGWRWIIYDDISDIGDIEASAFAERASLGPDAPIIIKIDYLQLVTGGDGDSPTSQFADISRRCKSLAKRLNAPVVALAQLRRLESQFDFAQKRTHHRPPVLEDLRDCGSFEQDADAVFLLDRDILHNPREAKLIIAKQRSGITHPGIPFEFHKETTTFIEQPIA